MRLRDLLRCVLAPHRYLVVEVSGGSMEPALHHRDRLLMKRDRSVLAIGTIVAVDVQEFVSRIAPNYPALMVKRIAAGPGDPFPDRNGVVPDGHAYVLGDTPNSLDSKAFGAIPVELIVGRMVAKLT